VGNDYLPYSVGAADAGPHFYHIQEIEHGSGPKVKLDYQVTYCQHCQDAPCIRKEFGDAVYRRPDGIVIIDPVKAKGNKAIVESCPYGVIAWNEEKQLAQKCTMCAHMLDNGEKVTRCSEACPTQAMIFGDLDDPKSPISIRLAEMAGKAEPLHPEYGTRPTTQYLRLTKPFVAGEVILADKSDECPEGVKVTLTPKAGGDALTTTTDFLGDFEFKWLQKNVEYTLRVERDGYQPLELSVKTDGSPNVGELVLTRK
jgi:Fe-S-cluster-containing dehydrogenase component